MPVGCFALIALATATAASALAEDSEDYVGIWAIKKSYCGEPEASKKGPDASGAQDLVRCE